VSAPLNNAGHCAAALEETWSAFDNGSQQPSRTPSTIAEQPLDRVLLAMTALLAYQLAIHSA
jgi:hypothetical protein